MANPLYTSKDVKKVVSLIGSVDRVADWVGTSPRAVHEMQAGTWELSVDMHEFCHRVLVDAPRLRAMIEENGWTQLEAANHSAVNERTMRRFLSGESAIPPNVWIKLAKAAKGSKP